MVEGFRSLLNCPFSATISMVLHMNAHSLSLFISIQYGLFSLEMKILFLPSGQGAGSGSTNTAWASKEGRG